MSVRLLEYTAPVPIGAIAKNGYVSFEPFGEDVPQAIKDGVRVYQLPPENKYEKFVHTEEGVEVRTVKTLPDRYMFDVHRRIDSYLDSEDIRGAVLSFANLYGCWFSADVGSKDYKLHTVDEWRQEWLDVRRAVFDITRGEDKLTAEHIVAKLNQFTEFALESSSGALAIKPKSIGGWVWALIYKDFYDNPIYTPCPNPKCNRELPSQNPITQRKVTYCSQSCKNAVTYKRRTK